MLEPRPAEEWHDIDADLFEKTIRTRGRPAILRGFAGSWPAVQAAWQRLRIGAGKQKTVRVALEPLALATFNEKSDAWSWLPGVQ